MDALKSLVQPLVGGTASSSVIDGMKLVVLGGTVETARRVSSSAWNHFVNSFFLTAHFSEEDLPYDWLMLWLSRRPEWQRSREFETTTRSANPGSNVYSPEDADWDAWEAVLGRESSSAYGYDDNSWGAGDDDEMRPKTRVVFQPTYDTTHTIFYRGHWLRVKRSRRQESGCEMLSISVVARNNAILKQLVLQAKKEYEAESVHRIQIYFADAHGSWRWTDSRHKRPMGSIVLNPGVKEMLLEDARDFLKSEKWYADRGIPFRRGYLLHGVPGSGKSSLIHALAGQLQLDIYVVSLSASWISDNTLTNLMGRVPARCVLLLEDLDAAFVRSTNREGEEDDSLLGALGGLDGDMKNALGSSGGRTGGGFNSGSGGGKSRRRFGRSDGLSDMNTLSLSGLLNALDGVAASEGRLLFATTNHLERLDPALSRPGRMDVWVEFKNASRWQAEALFRNFFPAYDEDDLPSTAEMDALHLDANMHVRTFVPNEDEIQLSSRSRTPSTSSSAPASPPSKPGLSLWNIASSAQSLLSSTPSSSTLNSRSSPPPEPSSHHPNMPPSFGASNTAYPAPPPSPSLKAHSVKPFLDKKTLSTLAKQFADAIPEEEFSVASLQGYLLKHKAQPYIAASGAAQWVESELHMRERLKKEKAEREVKLRQVRERKRKVREEKERVKKEKERKEKEKERVKKLIAEKEEEEELEKMKTQLKEKEEAAKKKKEEEAQAAKDAAKAAKKGKKKSKKAKGDAGADADAATTTTTTASADATPATDAAEGDAKATTSETKVEDAPKAEDKPVEASVSSSVVVVEAVADKDEDDSESGSDGEGNDGGSDGSGSDSWDEEDESDGSEA